MIETSGQLFHSFFSCIFSLHDFVIMDIIYKHSFLSKQNITVLIWKRHFKYHKKVKPSFVYRNVADARQVVLE